MTAPLVFLDTDGRTRSCPVCGVTFTVQFPSSKKTFCSYSCSNRVTAMSRTGPRNARYSHGMAGTKIYNIWADMVARCTRPTHKRYADYGGRGITVCDRWLDFANFYADMGDRPRGRSLDRVDNDYGYSPFNCRWATSSEQAKNRRTSGWQTRQRNEKGQFV